MSAADVSDANTTAQQRLAKSTERLGQTAPDDSRTVCGFRWRQGSIDTFVDCVLPYPHDGAHMCADDLA